MCNVFTVAKKLCEARNWNVSNLELQKCYIFRKSCI